MTFSTPRSGLKSTKYERKLECTPVKDRVGYMRLPQILEIIPIGRSTWWHWVSIGKAPQSVKLGPRTTVWKTASIYEFIDELEKQGGK